MSFDVMMTCLLAVSVLTTLTVEALKKVVNTKNYNVMAAVVAVVLSLALSVGYIFYSSIQISAQIVVQILVLMFLSFLSSTVGYDKVIQAIKQIKGV